jgi:hypothetical protein
LKGIDNSNYDNFHGGGDFSHVYVTMHKYFGKKPEMQKNEYIIFCIHFNMFSCMNYFLHILPTLGATNFKP